MIDKVHFLFVNLYMQIKMMSIYICVFIRADLYL